MREREPTGRQWQYQGSKRGTIQSFQGGHDEHSNPNAAAERNSAMEVSNADQAAYRGHSAAHGDGAQEGHRLRNHTRYAKGNKAEFVEARERADSRYVPDRGRSCRGRPFNR